MTNNECNPHLLLASSQCSQEVLSHFSRFSAYQCVPYSALKACAHSRYWKVLSHILPYAHIHIVPNAGHHKPIQSYLPIRFPINVTNVQPIYQWFPMSALHCNDSVSEPCIMWFPKWDLYSSGSISGSYTAMVPYVAPKQQQFHTWTLYSSVP